MAQIVVEIDNKSGKIYKSLSEEGRLQFQQRAILIIEKAIKDAEFNEYSKLLDDIGNEAEKNGLNPEILGKLLESDN